MAIFLTEHPMRKKIIATRIPIKQTEHLADDFSHGLQASPW
jgi:uncharacterized protein YejL (UPF0352 family)